MAMMISWVMPVNPSHPYLENDPAPSFAPTICAFHLGFSLVPATGLTRPPTRPGCTSLALLYHRPLRMIAEFGMRVGSDSPGRHGCKSPPPIAEGVAGKPSCKTPGRKSYFRYSSQGLSTMTLYGYARVSVREPEDKNLDL